jgi:hypothetical protein
MLLRFKLDIEYSQKWLAVYVSSKYTVYLYSYKNLMKSGNAPLQSIRLLDQVRERIRCMHYSLSTEKNLPALGEIFRALAWTQRRHASSA